MQTFCTSHAVSHGFHLHLTPGFSRFVVFAVQFVEPGKGLKIVKVRVFTVFLRDYVYSPPEGRFVPVPAMPLPLSNGLHDALVALHQISQGTVS